MAAIAAIYTQDLCALREVLDREPARALSSDGSIAPLSLAFRLGWSDGARLLISHGHSLSDRDAAGLPPIYWALATNSSIDVVTAVGTESDASAVQRVAGIRAILAAGPDFRGQVSVGVKLGWLTSLLARLLPQDVVRFTVIGGCARIDFSMGGFDGKKMCWRRGDYAYVCNDDGVFALDIAGKRYANALITAAQARVYRHHDACGEQPASLDPSAAAEAAVADARRKLLSSRWPTLRSWSGTGIADADRAETSLGAAARWLGLGGRANVAAPLRVKRVGAFDAHVERVSGVAIRFCVREPLAPPTASAARAPSADSREDVGSSPSSHAPSQASPASAPPPAENALLAAASAADAPGDNPIVSLFGPARTGAGRATAALSSFVVHSSAPVPSPSGSGYSTGGAIPVSRSEADSLAGMITPGCSIGELKREDLGLPDTAGPASKPAVMPPSGRNVERDLSAVVYTAVSELPCVSKDFVTALLGGLLCGQSAMERGILAGASAFIEKPGRGLAVAVKIPLVKVLGVVAYARVDELEAVTPAMAAECGDALFSIDGFTDATAAWAVDSFFLSSAGRPL